MKFSAVLFLGASLLAVSPVMAQTAPAGAAANSQAKKPVAGATLYDPQGTEIGTIETVTAEAVVVNTGTNKVALPPAAIGSNEKGLVASTTKADLDAAASKAHADAQAQLQAMLTAGTAVNSSDGQPVGTVKAADPQYVTVTTSQGVDVKLPANAFSLNQAGGGLMIAMTAANFNAAVAGSGATAGADAAGTAPTAGTDGAAAAGDASAAATDAADGATQ